MLTGTARMPTNVVPFSSAVSTTSSLVDRVTVIVDPPRTGSSIVAVMLISAPNGKPFEAPASTEVDENPASKGFAVSL